MRRTDPRRWPGRQKCQFSHRSGHLTVSPVGFPNLKRRGDYGSSVPAPSEPRAWAKQPELFGRYHRIEWREAERLADRVGLDAAKIQHDIAFLVREIRKQRRLGPWKDLAPKTGMSAYQLTKVLRGQAHMSLRHVAGLSRVFGPLLLGGVEARQALAAKAHRDLAT